MGCRHKDENLSLHCAICGEALVEKEDDDQVGPGRLMATSDPATQIKRAELVALHFREKRPTIYLQQDYEPRERP